MTDVTGNSELINQLKSLLGSAQQSVGQPAQSWDAAQAAATTGIHGVSVPLKLERPNGTVRVYLILGPEAAASPQALHAALDQLERQGLPLDVWGGGQGQGGWGGGSSWGNGGGRYGSRRGRW